MPQVEIAGRDFLVDEEGFLQQPEVRNDDVAALFASSDGMEELTPEHWAVVRFIRSYWEQSGSAPMMTPRSDFHSIAPARGFSAP